MKSNLSPLKQLASCLFIVVSLSQCRSDFNLGFSSDFYYSKERQHLKSAESAEEWADRVKLDLEEADYWSDTAGHLYAELPPQKFWDKAFELTGEVLDEHAQNNPKQILQILIAQMKGDLALAESLLQQRILTADISEYNRNDVLSALYAVSSDQEKTELWIKKNKADLLQPRKESSYEKAAKKDWEIELANNNIDKGLKLLWKTANLKSLSLSDRQDALSKILTVTSLLGRKQEAAKAVESSIQLFKQLAKKKDHFSGLPSDITNHLAEQQQWEELEALLNTKQSSDLAEYHSSDTSKKLLICSHFTQSTSDFLTKMDAHLSTLTKQQAFDALAEKMGASPSLGELYISALKKSGRTDETWALASRLTIFNRSSDTYYQLALETNPTAFPSLIKQISSYDPYEERPFIWMAKLALADGKIDDAAHLINQAISLDPSDGDQGKNSRMHAYAVLASVHAAKGDTEKEAFFREVVSAIRDGEEADDYLYAGLTNEAIKRYKASLGRFNDAYCLQSRLALTLAKNGRFEEAVPHFEKAFRLMPVSFGPRESHCFGCEGLYSDERVHPIAERILNEFVKAHPDNPRAPYLLGMVLDQMKQTEAANSAYLKALELDPKYYNAAKKLLVNYQKTPQNSEKVTKLIKQILKFAPYANLKNLYSSRSDLKQAWIDAGSTVPSPFTLDPLKWQLKDDQEQYVKGSPFNYYSHESDVQAIDGWSRSELLRDNQFLSTISSDLDSY